MYLFKTKGIIFQIFLFFSLSLLFSEDYLLGDMGLPDDYDLYINHNQISSQARSETLLPSYFNWADQGMVTEAKDQGGCGSCWAFAAVGAMEAKILMQGQSSYDLSEQQQISCNTTMAGCSGGSMSSLRFWETEGPMLESCTGYSANNGNCADYNQCESLGYRTTGYYTVDMSNIDNIKTSLYNDGPTYFRYTVYTDFYTYWNNGVNGDVYTNTEGTVSGGHAVLIIGWDDVKGAWLLKNSWGTNAGPNGDGTFWMAYEGHTTNLSFGMANVNISTVEPTPTPPDAIIVTTTDFAGTGSLNEAIEIANSDLSLSKIIFDIPGAGPHKIILSHSTGNLAQITSPVEIDGSNQSGLLIFEGLPPSGPGAPVDGLVFAAGSEGSKVYNLNTTGFLNAILIQNAGNINITDSTFSNSFARNIKIENGMGILIKNNVMQENTSLSIQISNSHDIAVLGNSVTSGSIIIQDCTNIYAGTASEGEGNYINNSCQGAEAAIIVTGISSNVQIINNIISNQRNGVAIYGTEQNNHDIVYNTFTDNSENDILISGSLHTILKNTITKNGQALFAGLKMNQCDSVNVTQNTITGTRIEIASSNNCTIGGVGVNANTIQNDPVGVSAYGALMLTDSNSISIMNNTITGNASNGIYLNNSNSNDIRMNTIYSNGRSGVAVLSGNNNKITMNVIYDHHSSAVNGNDSIMLFNGANADKSAPIIESIVDNGALIEISGICASGDVIELFESNNTTSLLDIDALKYVRTVNSNGTTWSVTVGKSEFEGAEVFFSATATDSLNNTSELSAVKGILINDGIAGPTVVSANVPYEYSIKDIPGTNYSWWINGDATIINNGQSTVTITFSEWFTAGTINVGYTDPETGWTVKTLEVSK